MPRFKNSRGVALMMIATAAFVVLPACGGGSSTPDYKVSANPLVIKTAVLPALLSGEDVDVEIELTGGCGGPYVVQVISPGVNGGMPPGVGLENREVPTEGPDGILGTLDDGVRNAAVMTGVLLRDGVYGFTIQCTDPTCTPAFHDQRSYNWSIGRGDVRIVGADPALIPEATLDVVPKHIAWDPLLPPPADPNLIPNTAAWALDYQPVDGVKTTVFGQFTAIDFIVAGGIPPYVLFNRDDGADPSDALGGADGLPLGIVIADASTSLVGTPSQILSGGVPFVLTLEAQDDSVIPLVSEWRKVQWKIDTPPIIVATPSIDSAFAGGSQTALIQVADGVPPFRFELLSIPGPEDLADHDYPGTPTYPACGPNDGLPHFCGVAAPGILLGINPADLGMANRRLYAGAVNRNVKFVGNDNSAVAGGEEYPLIDAIGPFSVFPSEGTYLIDQGPSSGTLAGIPARVGTFTIHVHVYSELVPKAYGQHAFKSYTYDVDDSDDNPGRPAFAMTPAFTSQNLFLPASQGYSDIPEGEVSVIYTPANSPAAPNGLQCTAEGGVANDGKTNGPHKSQVIDDGTTAGTYQWQAAFNDPIGGLAYDQANADAYFDFMTENNGISEGRFGIVAKLPAGPPSTDGDPNALTRRSRELIDVEVEDHQLPKRVDPLSHRKTEMRQLGLSVGPDKVIITDTANSGIGFPSSTATITQAAGQWDMHHAEHRVKKLEFKGGSGVISPLTSADLTAGTDIPDIGQDGIGATDLGQLLSGQSPGDPNVELLRPIVNATGWWDDMSHTGFYGARSGQHADFNAAYTYLTGDYRSNGGYQPNIASIDLPAYGIKPGFTPAPPAGTKADGIFLDGGQMYAFTGTNRMGFFIIRRDASVYVPFAIKRTDYQTFGDNMQAVKENRSNSMFRTLQMTVSPDNRYAVCEISKQSAGSQHHLNTIDQSMLVVFSLLGEKRPEWGNKTYALIDPTGMGLTLQPGGEGLYLMASSLAMTNNHVYFLVGNHSTDSYRRSSWTDHFVCRADIMSLACDLAPENGSPRWNQGTNSPMQTPFHKWYYNVISTYYTFVSTPPYSVAVQASDDDTYMYDGTNWQEFDHAPMPFRVSSNGRAMALLASDSPGLITSGSTVMRHEMWVDYDGNGFEEVAKLDAGAVARHSPMGSGRGYALGRGPNSYYHWLRSNGPTPGMEISDDGKRVAWVYFEGSAPANSPFSWQSLQQEMVCFSTSTDWSDVPSKEDVTKDFFGGIQLWRFGGPIFTKDNNGLVFWGGFSNYNVSSSSYADCRYFAGTFYSYNFSNDECRHMLDPADGGSADAAGTLYTTASKVSLSTAGSMSGSAGDVRPVTGFMGKGRDFYYVVSGYALGTGTHAGGQDRQTSGIVMCLNVSTLGGGSVNGKQNGRAFIVSGGLTRRGFCQVYYYYPMYAFYYGYFVPAKGSMGMGKSVVAKDSGHVFFASHYQSSGATKNTTYGPDQPTYWGDYGYRGMRIHGFDAEVAGPIADLTHTSIGSDTANRSIHFIEATPDGSRVSYVYDDYGTYHGHSDERLGHIWDIRFDEFTGVIHPSFNKDTDSQLLVQSDSRVGEGIAHDSTGRRVFYSVKSGNGGNENQKLLYEALRESDDSLTSTPAGVTGGSWYNVLYAGR